MLVLSGDTVTRRPMAGPSDMWKRVWSSLAKGRSGLLLAYLSVLLLTYTAIWQLSAPIGLEAEFDTLPDFARTRIFFHLVLTLVAAPHILLGAILIRGSGRAVNSASVLLPALTRALDGIAGNLRNIQTELERDYAKNTRNALAHFGDRVVAEFASLRERTAVMREIADGGVGNSNRNMVCLAIIDRVEGLQYRGNDLASIVQRGSDSELQFKAAIGVMSASLREIEEVAKSCTDAIHRIC